MRSFATFLLSLLVWSLRDLMGVASAQIEYDPATNRLVCARLDGSACLSESLSGSIVISCASSTLAEVRSCNIELAHLLPDGYKDSAVCYQAGPKSDAVCAFNGTGYSIQGAVTQVPETVLCDFVNPSAATKKSDLSVRKRSAENIAKMTSMVSDFIAKLLIRGFFTGFTREAKPYKKRASDKEETANCSNPWSAKDPAVNKATATRTSPTSMSLPLALIPTVSPSDVTPVNVPSRFKVNTTATDGTTTGYANITVVTRIVTVTAKPLTTTMQLTSTYIDRPIQTSFYLDTTSTAPRVNYRGPSTRDTLFLCFLVWFGFR